MADTHFFYVTIVTMYVLGYVNSRPANTTQKDDILPVIIGKGSFDISDFDELAKKIQIEAAEAGPLGIPPDDDETFQPIPMPTDFKSYDVLKRDGYITLLELINATGATENVEQAFMASDVNGDGKLTKDEFYMAPWMLQGDEANDVDIIDGDFHDDGLITEASQTDELPKDTDNKETKE